MTDTVKINTNSKAINACEEKEGLTDLVCYILEHLSQRIIDADLRRDRDGPFWEDGSDSGAFDDTD